MITLKQFKTYKLTARPVQATKTGSDTIKTYSVYSDQQKEFKISINIIGD